MSLLHVSLHYSQHPNMDLAQQAALFAIQQSLQQLVYSKLGHVQQVAKAVQEIPHKQQV